MVLVTVVAGPRAMIEAFTTTVDDDTFTATNEFTTTAHNNTTLQDYIASSGV